jgi:hypothetical protein
VSHSAIIVSHSAIIAIFGLLTCGVFAGVAISDVAAALLADGVPYYRTEGFWARVGFGALDPDLPARVLEYLGVE